MIGFPVIAILLICILLTHEGQLPEVRSTSYEMVLTANLYTSIVCATHDKATKFKIMAIPRVKRKRLILEFHPHPRT